MMMKKLVVHVGPHKTGTTYIQSLLHENRKKLLSNNIIYPDVYFLYLGHHYLLNELNGNADENIIRSIVYDVVGGVETCIISSENFINLTKKGLQKLKSIFSGVEITFVVYSRCPSIRLVSRWHELVKQGSYQSMESYFTQLLFKPMQSREINLAHYLNDLVNIFGKESIKLVDYESANKSQNMIGSFLASFKQEGLIEDTNAVVNKMVSLEEVEIIRVLNFIASKKNQLYGSNMRESYYRIKKEVPSFNDEVKMIENNIAYFSKEMVLGDTGFDVNVKNYLKNNFSENFVNDMSGKNSKKYSVPSTDWIMDNDLRSQVEEIAEGVISKAKHP